MKCARKFRSNVLRSSVARTTKLSITTFIIMEIAIIRIVCIVRIWTYRIWLERGECGLFAFMDGIACNLSYEHLDLKFLWISYRQCECVLTVWPSLSAPFYRLSVCPCVVAFVCSRVSTTLTHHVANFDTMASQDVPFSSATIVSIPIGQ